MCCMAKVVEYLQCTIVKEFVPRIDNIKVLKIIVKKLFVAVEQNRISSANYYAGERLDLKLWDKLNVYWYEKTIVS